MLKKIKYKFYKGVCSKPMNLGHTDQKQGSNSNFHHFSVNLDKSQSFIFKRTSTTLHEEWSNLPKKKQKLYYKLYYKLYKSEIYQKEKTKKKSTSKWIHSASVKPFWAKEIYNKFTVKRHNGYTIHGENVLDFGNYIYTYNAYNYKKFKNYHKF